MKLKMYNKIIFSILSFILIFCSSTMKGSAAESKIYDISKGNVVISKSGNYRIIGNTDTYSIVVKKGVSANVELEDVTIKRKTAPVKIMSGGAANFILKGKNVITCTDYKEDYTTEGAGIHVPEGTKFVISPKSTGSLIVTGGRNGSGIGGNCILGENEGTGNIIIRGGTVTAIGGRNGCGIGGGTSERNWEFYPESGSGAGTILISGGSVTAIGGEGSSAGLGGSSLKKQGKITISGGIVNASSNAAGIGGENKSGKGNIITITGGTVTANGNNYAAGIGNSLNPLGTTVIIRGGMVKAKGDCGNRVLDDYVIGFNGETKESLRSYDIAAEKTVIAGGNIMAFSFSSQPVNVEGIKLNQAIFNCNKGKISSIKYGAKSYENKDMNSNGYISIFLPYNTSGDIIVKSETRTLLKAYYITASWNILQNAKYEDSMTLDLSKGNVEIVGNGFIYNNNIYNSPDITITGSTKNNNIIIHPVENKRKPNITFENVSVDLSQLKNTYFLNLGNDVTATIRLKGENKIVLGGESNAIFVGNGANLKFTGSSEEDCLLFQLGAKSNGVFTNCGDIQMYGGRYHFDDVESISPIYLGNYGVFTMYGGKLEHNSENNLSIAGGNKMKVNIHGGNLQVGTIGYYENSNEEIPNNTQLVLTGGYIESSGRIIFQDYTIHGGTLKARILGCGTGCTITQYSGIIEAGALVNTQKDEVYFTTLQLNYGGKMTIKNDVPQEEMDKIIKFRS